MKQVILLFYFLWSFSSHSFAMTKNKIDSLLTNHDVELFLQKNCDGYHDFNINTGYLEKTSQTVFDSLNIDLWNRADIDKNGFTDLIVIWKSYNSFITVLAFAHNTYKIVNYTEDFDCTFKTTFFPKLDTVDNLSVIKLYKFNFCRFSASSNFEVLKSKINLDTITIYDGEFFELSKKTNDVKKIVIAYESWGWTRKITIKENRNIRYKNYLTVSIFRTNLTYRKLKQRRSNKIPKSSFDSLWLRIKKIDWDNLKSEYVLNCFEDAVSANTTVYYNNKQKRISDYPLCGTLGLIYIYHWTDKWYNENIKEK